jgi:prepilin-type N-terminal cleavage/methylation domain-containing protein
MNRTHRTLNRKGFTLIELIAVVVVLAILAGVALPKYFDYAAQAKVSACKGALGGVRAGVANFYANAAVSGTAAYPTLAQLETIGTVMQEAIPVNPYNNSNDVVAATWNAAAPPVSGVAGWNYDFSAGKFWANSNTVGENAF